MRKASLNNKIAMLLLLAISLMNHVKAEDNREYQLKAAYLLNFARFIYWPEDVFESDVSVFTICIYGENQFGDLLDTLSNKLINNRPIKVKYIKERRIDLSCRIAFLSKSSKANYPSLLDEFPDHTLTVSDIENFSQHGGMIEFIQVKNKIKFEINVVKSSEKGIKYRSQLLEVAERLR